MCKKLMVRIRRSMYMIPLEQVVYLENQLRKIRMRTTDERGEYCFYSTFRQIREQLDRRFLSGSRTYILNARHIRALLDEGGEYVIVMSNGDRLSFCKNSFLRFRQEYEKWMLGEGKRRSQNPLQKA